MKEKGVRLIDEKPRRGAGGAMIAFLHPKSTGGVLLELCERHKSTAKVERAERHDLKKSCRSASRNVRT